MRSGQRLKRLCAKGHYSGLSQDDLKRAGLSPVIYLHRAIDTFETFRRK